MAGSRMGLAGRGSRLGRRSREQAQAPARGRVAMPSLQLGIKGQPLGFPNPNRSLVVPSRRCPGRNRCCRRATVVQAHRWPNLVVGKQIETCSHHHQQEGALVTGEVKARVTPMHPWHSQDSEGGDPHPCQRRRNSRRHSHSPRRGHCWGGRALTVHGGHGARSVGGWGLAASPAWTRRWSSTSG